MALEFCKTESLSLAAAAVAAAAVGKMLVELPLSLGAAAPTSAHSLRQQ